MSKVGFQNILETQCQILLIQLGFVCLTNEIETCLDSLLDIKPIKSRSHVSCKYNSKSQFNYVVVFVVSNMKSQFFWQNICGLNLMHLLRKKHLCLLKASLGTFYVVESNLMMTSIGMEDLKLVFLLFKFSEDCGASIIRMTTKSGCILDEILQLHSV